MQKREWREREDELRWARDDIHEKSGRPKRNCLKYFWDGNGRAAPLLPLPLQFPRSLLAIFYVLSLAKHLRKRPSDAGGLRIKEASCGGSSIHCTIGALYSTCELCSPLRKEGEKKGANGLFSGASV